MINKNVKQAAENLLESLRPALTADGYNIEILSANEEIVKLRLIFTPEACMDCIMPNDYLVKLFQDAIHKDTNLDVKVRIDDPRD